MEEYMETRASTSTSSFNSHNECHSILGVHAIAYEACVTCIL